MSPKTILEIVVSAFVILTATPSHAQEEPLVTDRPDFTESSSTVARGVLQLDVRVARRLSDSGPDLLIGAGVSWRIGG